MNAVKKTLGFVVYNDQYIWGHGLTEADAWDEAREYAGAENIAGMEIAPAAAGLFKQVADEGGDVFFHVDESGIANQVQVEIERGGFMNIGREWAASWAHAN